MPTWSEILTELKVESAQGNSAPFDFIRRKYLSELSGKSSVSCPLKPSDSTPLKHSTMPP